MATNEELIQMARTLKENCENCYREGKCNCAFAIGYECMINSVPSFWQLPKPRRWTDADIQLAKGLKAFGATAIQQRGPGGKTALNLEGTGAMWLPRASFAGIEYRETVSIDDILKEDSE